MSPELVAAPVGWMGTGRTPRGPLSIMEGSCHVAAPRLLICIQNIVMVDQHRPGVAPLRLSREGDSNTSEEGQ